MLVELTHHHEKRKPRWFKFEQSQTLARLYGWEFYRKKTSLGTKLRGKTVMSSCEALLRLWRVSVESFYCGEERRPPQFRGQLFCAGSRWELVCWRWFRAGIPLSYLCLPATKSLVLHGLDVKRFFFDFYFYFHNGDGRGEALGLQIALGLLRARRSCPGSGFDAKKGVRSLRCGNGVQGIESGKRKVKQRKGKNKAKKAKGGRGYSHSPSFPFPAWQACPSHCPPCPLCPLGGGAGWAEWGGGQERPMSSTLLAESLR